MKPGESRHFFSMRRSLIVGAFVVTLVTLIVFAVSTYSLVIAPIVRDLAHARLTDTSQQIESKLNTLVTRVDGIALASR
ncbi:MAG TPA: hypothetical protein VM432_02395, partial [Bdellovibrionales bacterium]|nr:hypothetical protein [Bdellovibrionales bacterium]